MPENPKETYLKERERVQAEDLYPEDKEAILEFASALDAEDPTVTFLDENGKQKTSAYNTLKSYLYGLRRFATHANYPLMDTTADEINRVAMGLYQGTHPAAPEGGYSRGTVSIQQTALRNFYRYYDDVLDYKHITRFTTESTAVDERDMFTREEVNKLRKAATHPRDRCLLELLLNTGQRISAIQGLRIKDIDIENGVYYLNPEDGGLKGAEKRGLKRPLLGAKASVAEWLQHHKRSDNREAYLVTPRMDAPNFKVGDKLTRTSINRALKKLGKEAGVNKPLNPHNFRHYFVTSAKLNYGLDDSTIKFLIGHQEGSKVMETTYTHLSTDDYIKSAEVEMGLREEDADSPLTPETCPTCNIVLDEGAKACSNCGAVFTPDAAATKNLIEDLSMQGMREAKDDQQADDVEEISRWLRDNPDIAVELQNNPEKAEEIFKEKFGGAAGD